MAIRLNKDMIADIIDKAIRATSIPSEIEAVKKELQERVHSYIKSKTPPALLELAAQHPREWFHWASTLYTSWNQKACMANPLWHFSQRNDYSNPSIPIEPVPNAGNYPECPYSIYKDLGDKAKEIMARKTELEESLRVFLISRRTVEAALKDMPELEPFVPKGTASSGGALVAASNVAALLTKSGFPQGKA